MANKENGSEIIEQGNIFFFYRPKIDTEEVEDIKDVQRFYMVTGTESTTSNKRKDDTYRLFLVG